MAYRVGVDVGDRSVGLAAVEYDDDGWPIRILAAVSHIHDGGKDPDTGKSPQSRLATAGVARRTRRLTRNKRKRLSRLDAVLREVGYAVPSEEVPQTYDAWHARAALVHGLITDAEERDAVIVTAVRHIARHRGWRNPWWSYARLSEAPVPSEAFVALVTSAQSRFGASVAADATLGQVVSAIASRSVVVRPRQKGLVESGTEPVMSTQGRQEDSLAELHRGLSVQRVPAEVADRICGAVFFQATPTVPRSRIGVCTLIPSELRAPLAALEFQEYRVRATVANLRVGKARRELTDGEHDLVCDRLLAWRELDRPQWRDVAEWLELAPRELRVPSIDETGSTSVPADRTSTRIEKSFARKSQVRQWWDAAEGPERAEFIAQITDLSGEDAEAPLPSVAEFAASWSSKTMEDLDKLTLESGRAAYSREALRRLNDVMRDARCDVHTARKDAFGLDDSWQPPGPAFTDDIEHPAVRRVNTLVHRFLSTAILKWGLPEAVTVEHVRGAFMGPAALAELKYEIGVNTRRRDAVKAELAAQGVLRPSDIDVRRHECIERQNGMCLYCGTAIGMASSELDHIVARSTGGGNRRDNVVATCRPCNADKGKTPFAVWAATSPRSGVSVDDARQRVRSWAKGRLTSRQLFLLKRDVSRRLSLAEDDEEAADRSIESTAYAAREMRARIDTYLAREATRLGAALTPEVHVYQGLVTSEARKAGGVDDRLRLRTFTRKSRLDRRHHAVDAAVLTTLGPGVARTLKERAELASTHRVAQDEPGWKEYQGSSAGAQRAFTEWRLRIGVLADRLAEEIAADRVSVVRPLRLVPRVGAVHADTIEPLTRKEITDAFSAEEILRVCDERSLDRLSDLAGDAGMLPSDPSRGHLLDWPTTRGVMLYPSNAAYIPVRGGAAAIGSTVQYSRVYAWRGHDGFEYGTVRLYTGEFARIGFLQSGIDLLTHPLPRGSQAMRTANPRLRQRILTGQARQIGWIAVGDEIEVDVESLGRGDSKMARFLAAVPENRWTVTGFSAADKVSLAPSLLAFEGADDSTPPAVADVLAANRIPLAINVVLGGAGVAVIRRTVLGRPRWSSAGLVSSWRIEEAVDSAFRS